MSCEDAHNFLCRLQVTMRGLDFRTIRPNAVLLLADSAVKHAVAIAEIISMTLFDSPERIVSFDMGRIVTAEECNIFFGAPPGYVGYSDAAPVHAIKQIPSCILLLKNIDCCNNHALQLIEQGIKDGFFLDGQSQKIYLSDAIIILTAKGITSKTLNPIGFGSLHADISNDACRQKGATLLGNNFMNLVDIVCSLQPDETHMETGWIRDSLLAELSSSYRKLNLDVAWDDSLIKWLANEYKSQASENHLERIVDEQITPTVMRYANSGLSVNRSVSIFYKNEVFIED